jgi:hypothetical protein
MKTLKYIYPVRHSLIFGTTGIVTLVGSIFAILQRDVDLMLSFVFFGILCAYSSDALTSLRVNCTAGDTTANNIFSDDSFDASKELCKTYTYTATSGLCGAVAAFFSGYFAVLMKMNGKFYPQRPVCIFLGLCGMALVFSFTYLGASVSSCHYYNNGKDILSPHPGNHLDDVVYDQLEPLCFGYKSAAITAGVGAMLALIGIPLLALIKKAALWVNIAWVTAFLSGANLASFRGVMINTCDQYQPPNIPSAKENALDIQCTCSRIASYLSGLGVISSTIGFAITWFDVFVKFDHDSLIIRVRRSILFLFVFTYIGSIATFAVSNMTSNCDIYNHNIDDDLVSASTDDVILNNNCKGYVVQVFFYVLSLFGVSLAIIASLIFNFPADGAAPEPEGDSASKLNANNLKQANRLLSRDTPIASSFFRSTSYMYAYVADYEDDEDSMDKSSLRDVLI